MPLCPYSFCPFFLIYRRLWIKRTIGGQNNGISLLTYRFNIKYIISCLCPNGALTKVSFWTRLGWRGQRCASFRSEPLFPTSPQPNFASMYNVRMQECFDQINSGRPLAKSVGRSNISIRPFVPLGTAPWVTASPRCAGSKIAWS